MPKTVNERVKNLEKKYKKLEEELSTCNKARENLEKEPRAKKVERDLLIVTIIIQIAIGIGIWRSVSHSGENIELMRKNIQQQEKFLAVQSEFYRNSLNPWIFIKPQSYLAIKGDSVTFYCFTKCTGKTPGYDVIADVRVTSSAKYAFTDKEPKAIPAFVYPQENVFIHERIALQSIRPNIVVRDSVFLHFLQRYKDFDGNLYQFVAIFKLREIKGRNKSYGENIYNCGWNYVWSHYELIRNDKKVNLD